MLTVAPYRIDIPQQRFDEVRDRLTHARWPDIPDTAAGTDGVDPLLVRSFVEHVGGRYDWRAEQAALNAWPHRVCVIDGIAIHFLHVTGSGVSPRPLLLLHGWPGSFIEFLEVAQRLSNPERFGGRPDEAWSVVIPSLPGFALSSKPAAPIGPRCIAGLFDRLMREALGYDSYVAQGGDWGSVIASWLGYESDACRAIHINFTLGWAMRHLEPQSEPELAAAARAAQFMSREGAYIQMQATKPLTLSYAMTDSPLGASAWIIEKFNNWSDLAGEPLWSHFNRDRLATLILLYLLTDSFGTASWIYRGMYAQGEGVPRGARVAKPTGVAFYPGEIGAFPRSMVERVYDVVHWAEPARGGHFAAFEQPCLFAEDILAFGRVLDG